jgi:two-component sensor histidine kinase
MAQGGSPAVVVAISDSAPGRAALGRLLRAGDYRVRMARPDGPGARVLTPHRPDVIVLDADPRDASVAALLRGLDADAAPRAPIIRLDESGGRAVEADLLLPSPVRGAVLRRAVRAALRLRRAELEAARAQHLRNEIAHRVRGHLAMVTGLLQMQVAAHADERVCAALRGAVSRLRTMGELQDLIYAPRGDPVPLAALLRRVAEGARDVFAGGNPVELLVAEHTYACSPEQATNLSVIAHELVANAVRHGGPGPDGRRRVEVRAWRRGGDVRLSVWGTGRPVPKGFDVRAQRGTGLRVVSDLVSQYGGSFTLRPRAGGTVAMVRIGATGGPPGALR